MIRFKHYISLLEAKIDDYKAQENSISTEHDPEAKHKSASDIIDHFHKHTPGGNVQHTRWMIDRYKKGEMKQEDAPDMHDTLTNFEKYKHNLPKKKVEQYKSISDLKTAIHPHKEQDQQIKSVNQDKINKGSTVIHHSQNVTAYHVHSTEAAQELGKSTKGEKLGWCTSHPDPQQNMFNHYNDESEGNFHILHMHKEKFPYRRIGGVGVEGQFQDENNKTIEGDRLEDFVHRNPEVNKIAPVKRAYDDHVSNKKLDSPTASKKDIDDGLHSENWEVRNKAIKHPNVDEDHLHTALNDKFGNIKNNAITNPKINSSHIDKVLQNTDNSSVTTRELALTRPKAVTTKHLDKAINDPHSLIRKVVAAHPLATKEHLQKLANDDSQTVSSIAKERLTKMQ